MRIVSLFALSLAVAGFPGPASAFAQPSPPRVSLLDVPYIQQSEALCAGAAAAMVMRYWGAAAVYAESFAPLVDRSARGIHGEDLLRDLRSRGWQARSFRGDRQLVAGRLAAHQPVVALIEDRPGSFHFVVVVGWINGRVVYHDPARSPFRVTSEDSFEAAWQKSERWTMLLLPGAAGNGSDTAKIVPAAEVKKPCDDLVAEGVRSAGTGDTAAALNVFDAAAELCPTVSAPLRESAGVFAVQGNWAEARRRAGAAVKRDRSDAHAWRILATSEYVRGDPGAALAAWNAVGEPVVDLVTVIGLGRTRHAAASSLVGLEPNAMLTTGRLDAAGRRLGELPAAEFARVNYKPRGEGRATVDAVVVERPLLPTSRAALAVIGVRLLSDRELAVSVSSPTGGGELVTGSWRWWANRPRLAVSYAAPSRVGVWRADAFGERQTYDNPIAPTSESRRGGSLTLAHWTSTLLRWEAGAGVDAWGEGKRTVSVSAAADQRLFADRLSLRASGSVFGGSFGAWTAGIGARWRSSTGHRGTVLETAAGLDTVSTGARLALWPGAGTGTGREALLRAHPLLDDGRVRGDVFGRRLAHASVEARRWIKPLLKVARLAPAAFLDLASAEDRLRPGRAWHADAGVGLRLAVPGSGVMRVDVGKGLRDGATAWSVEWNR